MTRAQYLRTIAIWEKKYGVKSRAFSYSPREVKLTCEKCGIHTPGKMARHHKANDFFFALWAPDWYAARYLTFAPEDIAKLCQKCHNKVEKYYKGLKRELYHEHSLIEMYGDKLTREWCEKWREKFRKLYEKWLKLPARKSHKRKMKK